MLNFITENYSISNRISVSVIFNTLRGIMTFITGVILARFLGPDDFGRMAFLLATFLALKSLLDMSSSHAFFTFLSKKNRSRYFINIYWCWMAFQLIFSLTLVGILLPSTYLESIWQNENKILILLALIATFMQHSAWQVASQMAEANRQTANVQILASAIIFSHLLLVLLLKYLDFLTLPVIFISVSFEWLIGAYFAAKMYKGNDNENDNLLSIGQEFWVYCKPLIPLAWLTFFYEFLDKWMLQFWAGSEEQAFYAVASSFSLIAIIATTSIVKVLWKEVAEAHNNKDHKKIERLFNKSTKFLYFIGSCLAGLFVPWSKEIIYLTVGEAYAGANIAFILMLMYPAHQSLGQISLTLLYATEKVKIISVVNIIFILLSLVVAYLLLAPTDAYIQGLQMGSKGLAWKMLIMQFIQVNVLVFIISKIFDWRYSFLYQFYVLGGAVLLGFVVKYLILGIISNIYLGMFASMLIYVMLLALIFYTYPHKISGIEKYEINTFLINLNNNDRKIL